MAISPNGKKYIGQTVRSLKARKLAHRNRAKTATHKMANSIRKHGINNFEWKILKKNIPEARLNLEEILAIYIYDTYYDGLNSTLGGDYNPMHNPESRKKQSEKVSGENNVNYGKKRPPEVGQNISKAKIAARGLPDGMQRCAICKKIFPESEFTKKITRCKKCYREYSSEYMRKARRKATSQYWYKVKNKVSKVIMKIIKNKYANNLYLSSIKCRRDDFKKHLESYFSDGMSWENYGANGWVVAAVVSPKVIKDKNDNENIAIVCNYRNFIPIWHNINRSSNERNKYIKSITDWPEEIKLA